MILIRHDLDVKLIRGSARGDLMLSVEYGRHFSSIRFMPTIPLHKDVKYNVYILIQSEVENKYNSGN